MYDLEVALTRARKALSDHEEERQRLSAIEDRLSVIEDRLDAIEEKLDELTDLARSQGLVAEHDNPHYFPPYD